MPLNKLIAKAEANPQKLFLIDGLGALLSAFLLGVVLVKFESFFGIPASTLYLLAALPIFFALYDFYCYLKVNDTPSKFLQGIAVVNLLYCGLSIGCSLYHLETITIFGWAYIIGEVFIVIALALIEFRVANRLIPKN